jgi:hypothetical protein
LAGAAFLAAAGVEVFLEVAMESRDVRMMKGPAFTGTAGF